MTRSMPQKILIVGAHGQMGQWFTSFFDSAGYDVQGIDKDEWKNIDKHLLTAQIVLVSVPLSQSVEIITQLASKMNSGQLLCDISSLKENQLQALQQAPCEILALHPLFGPMTKNLMGQRFIFCGTLGSKGRILLDLFQKEGALIDHMNAPAHDKTMAFVQALTYGHLFALGKTYAQDNVHMDTLLPYSTPMYRMMASMLGRLFSQNPHLYAAIILENPYAKTVLKEYADSIASLLKMDTQQFQQEFTKISRSLGQFTQTALDQSERAMQVFVAPQAQQTIVCRKLDPVAVQEKGKTYEWCKNLPGLQISLYERAKGSLFACHYHTGKDPSKNPERFLLLSGSIEVSWKDLHEGHGKFIAHAPSEVIVGPYVYHEFRALESVLFIEYRSTVFDPRSSDSYTLEEFGQLMKETKNSLAK